MIKKFYKPEPIEIETETLSGEKVTLRIETFTHKMSSDILKACSPESGSEDGSKILCRQMSILFNLPEKYFYENFDPRVVKAIIEYTTKAFTTPYEATKG